MVKQCCCGIILVKRVTSDGPMQLIFFDEKEYDDALHHFRANSKKYKIKDNFWGFQVQTAKNAIYLVDNF